MTASIWKACKLSLSCLPTFSVALKLPPSASGSKLSPCELKLPPCRTHFRILTYMEEVNFLYVRTTKKKHWDPPPPPPPPHLPMGREIPNNKGEDKNRVHGDNLDQKPLIPKCVRGVCSAVLCVSRTLDTLMTHMHRFTASIHVS